MSNLLTTRNPWNALRNFDDFFSGFNPALSRRGEHEGMLSADWVPSVDITEDKDAFKIKAELPEVDKKDVKVAIDKNILTISGERSYEKTDEKEHRIERSFGSFSRSFSLPENIDDANIHAESKNGMLYLTIPKSAPKEKLKSIEIH